MRTAVRIVVALWYLPGWMAHVYLGLVSPETYCSLCGAPLIPAYTLTLSSRARGA